MDCLFYFIIFAIVLFFLDYRILLPFLYFQAYDTNNNSQDELYKTLKLLN